MATHAGVNGQSELPALHTTAEDFLRHDYDFIIAGGGTAGLVVAARLTENEGVTVGVLEAGTSKLGDMMVDSPVAFMQTFNHPDYDWSFKTEPQVGGRTARETTSRQRGRLLTPESGRHTTGTAGTISLAARPWAAPPPLTI